MYVTYCLWIYERHPRYYMFSHPYFLDVVSSIRNGDCILDGWWRCVCCICMALRLIILGFRRLSSIGFFWGPLTLATIDNLFVVPVPGQSRRRIRWTRFGQPGGRRDSWAVSKSLGSSTPLLSSTLPSPSVGLPSRPRSIPVVTAQETRPVLVDMCHSLIREQNRRYSWRKNIRLILRLDKKVARPFRKYRTTIKIGADHFASM